MFGSSPFGASPFGSLGTTSAIVADPIEETATASDTLTSTLTPWNLTNSAFAVDSLTSSLGRILYGYNTETGSAADTLTYLDIAMVREPAEAHTVIATVGTFVNNLLSGAIASEVLAGLFLSFITESAEADDALDSVYERIVQLRDTALATDATLTSAQLSSLLIAAAVAHEALLGGFAANIVETASAVETATSLLRAVEALLEQAEATVALVDTLSLIAFIEEGATAESLLSSQGQFFEALSDTASAAVVLRIGGEEYTAWVLNTENIATTHYTNYSFNSFANPGTYYYGGARDGLYLLDGDTDDGDNIDAYFRAPLTDFGFGSLKRLPELYIGYTSPGNLVFKMVVVSPNGVKEEHWYRLKPRTADGTRESVVPVGKGLKSVYWQYEVANLDGADFQIENIRLWPMGLTRRIR